MKIKVPFVGILFLFIVSCSSPNLKNLKLEILKQEISLIIESHQKDRDIIDSQPLEDVLAVLKSIFIDENNYEFAFGPDDPYKFEVLNNNKLLAEITLGIEMHLSSNKTTVLVFGRLYDDMFNQYIKIKPDDNAENLDEPNISFTHMYRNTDEYYYENTYYTNGNIAYSVNKYELIDPTHPLVENYIIHRVTKTRIGGEENDFLDYTYNTRCSCF
jgi:hypothetical protein